MGRSSGAKKPLIILWNSKLSLYIFLSPPPPPPHTHTHTGPRPRRRDCLGGSRWPAAGDVCGVWIEIASSTQESGGPDNNSQTAHLCYSPVPPRTHAHTQKSSASTHTNISVHTDADTHTHTKSDTHTLHARLNPYCTLATAG